MSTYLYYSTQYALTEVQLTGVFDMHFHLEMSVHSTLLEDPENQWFSVSDHR